MSGAARQIEQAQKRNTPGLAVVPEDTLPPQPSPKADQDFSLFQSDLVVEELRQYELATGGQRAMAILIDGIILSPVIAAFQSSLGVMLGRNDLALFLYTQFFTVAYFCFMHFHNGQTLGKKIMKIRVVPDAGGDLLSFRQALSRNLLSSILAGPSFLLSYLGAFRREDRKTWYDLICKTHVIRVK